MSDSSSRVEVVPERQAQDRRGSDVPAMSAARHNTLTGAG